MVVLKCIFFAWVYIVGAWLCLRRLQRRTSKWSSRLQWLAIIVWPLSAAAWAFVHSARHAAEWIDETLGSTRAEKTGDELNANHIPD